MLRQCRVKLTFVNDNTHELYEYHRSCEGGAWQGVLRQCQEQPAVRGHTLTGFLLKPMQRITRYPLLIAQASRGATTASRGTRYAQRRQVLVPATHSVGKSYGNRCITWCPLLTAQASPGATAASRGTHYSQRRQVLMQSLHHAIPTTHRAGKSWCNRFITRPVDADM